MPATSPTEAYNAEEHGAPACPMSEPQNTKPKHASRFKLDDIGWKILHELQLNGKLSYAELARRCKRTTTAIIFRVARMEEVGIITGYRAHVNPKALGMSLTAIIRMSVAPDQVKELTAVVKKCVGVSECYSGRGEASTFFIQAHLMSIERLEALLDRLAPYGTPIATIVLSSPVEHRAIEPPQRE